MRKAASFQSNLDGVAEIAGAVDGLEDALDGEYMGDMIKKAHFDASVEFDRAAAATAAAGRFSHMYEFGVPGITLGPVRFPDPTAPAARLWTHEIAGRAGTQQIFMAFRPALAPNPRPSVGTTGASYKEVRKLSRRKYIFRQKAFITETGQTVEITPKNGDMLFVPFYGQQPTGDPTNTRGFMLYPFGQKQKPLQVTPGRERAGQFTAFWLGWWSAMGERMISNSVIKSATVDVDEALAAAVMRANRTTIKPVTAASKIDANRAASRQRTKEKIARKKAREVKRRR